MPAALQKRRRRGSISQRPDGRWQVQLTRRDGRRLTEYIAAGTPDGERRAEEVLARLIHEELDSQTEPSRLTLTQWLDEYLARANQGKSGSTVRDRAHLRQGIDRAPLGRMRLGQITPRDVQRWLDGLDGAHRTRSKRLQLLKAALSEAVALGYLRANPAAPVKIPRQAHTKKVRRAWTAEQARRYLEATARRRTAPFWELLLLTGMRVGEGLALQVTDYDPHRRTLNIERTISTAEGRSTRDRVGVPKTPSSIRKVPLTDAAQAAVERWLVTRQQMQDEAGDTWQDGGWLFCNTVGGIWSYDNARRDYLLSLKLADVPQIRTHDLRVTFISLALQRGAKPEVVAKIVGHSSPSITLNIYREVYQDEMDDTRALLADLI
ncbi:tyrosine-type recombinase/integrase [Deinococcus lacus]|uniref:Tyrosine-type recombinase/integrase n=1 Tax=Deinococcus lacus TaxID=392561 RepID=A0ABW1YCE3_9DEIO